MSSKVPHKRYFTNTLKDYEPGQLAEFPVTQWKQKISQMMSLIVDHQPPSPRDCDGGLYVGCVGVGYMLYHASQSPVFAAERSQLLKQALRYVTVAQDYAGAHHDVKTSTAFLLGSVGVHAVAAAVYHSAGDEASYSANVNALASSINQASSTSKSSADELFVGRAGQMAAALWLNSRVGEKAIPEQDIDVTGDTIIESGRKYAKHNRSPAPLMYSYYDTEYLGAAHGLCSILQMLLCRLPTDAGALADVRASVDFMLGLQTDGGNFPCALDEVRHPRRHEDELVHWCHGAPGVVYLLAKAWLTWRDDKYLAACLRCGELAWERGLLRKGPGICHGVAGSGYVFLLLYRLTRDDKHLHRARRMAEFVTSDEFKREARTPDCPYSLYEGLAGTVCFLVDVMTPDTAAFPFQDVF